MNSVTNLTGWHTQFAIDFEGEINAELDDLSQSALSQHLKPMRDIGAVETRRASQTIYYRLADDPAVHELIEWWRRHRRA